MPNTQPLNQDLSLTVIKTVCSTCNLRELCLPFGLSLEELERLDDLISTRRRIKRKAPASTFIVTVIGNVLKAVFVVFCLGLMVASVAAGVVLAEIARQRRG